MTHTEKLAAGAATDCGLVANAPEGKISKEKYTSTKLAPQSSGSAKNGPISLNRKRMPKRKRPKKPKKVSLPWTQQEATKTKSHQIQIRQRKAD
eukprot:14443877-Ditylum_brightwellii.AAC.1